jgi:hypothetical protein
MSNDIGQISSFYQSDGVVTVEDNIPLRSYSRGTVLLNCVLPNGSITKFKLTEVIYVPDLGHSLVSWNVLRGTGYHMHDVEFDELHVSYNQKLSFVAKYIGSFPYLYCANVESACTTSSDTVNPNKSDYCF